MMNIPENENQSFGISEMLLSKISWKHKDSVIFLFTIVKTYIYKVCSSILRIDSFNSTVKICIKYIYMGKMCNFKLFWK